MTAQPRGRENRCNADDPYPSRSVIGDGEHGPDGQRCLNGTHDQRVTRGGVASDQGCDVGSGRYTEGRVGEGEELDGDVLKESGGVGQGLGEGSHQ